MSDVRFRNHLRRGGEVALLCYLDHPDGAVRYWSRSGTLKWDGAAWQGLGALGRVVGVTKTTTLEIKQVTLELRGVPSAAVASLSAKVRNRSAKVWLAAISRQQVVATYNIIDDLMDYQRLKIEDNGLVAVKIVVNVGLWTIERATNLAWTLERQQARFPDCTGLTLLPSFANKQSNWRRDP